MGTNPKRWKVVIPGGSGQVGGILARWFHARGDEVVVLSRQGGSEGAPWRVVGWDGRTQGPWAEELEGADAVINLAGRSVNCRYSAGNRIAILDSRLESTRAVGRAIAGAKRPPRVWLQAGTATIYADVPGGGSDEASGAIGGGSGPDRWRFSVEVAKAWEREVERCRTPETRKVILRSAMTMGTAQGGVLDVLLGLVRLGLGGCSGDGRQSVSWIHEADFARGVAWLIEHEEVDGPVNLSAPAPLPNGEFMRALREVAGVPFGLPASGWILELGTRLMRTESELVLKSRRVVPGKLLAGGFGFEFPDWPGAAADLYRRWREVRASASGRAVRPASPLLRA